MGIYRADLELLERQIRQMAAFERNLDERLGELDRQIAELHLTWTGLAATAQRQAHEEWTRGATAMRQALTDLRAAAAVAHSNYTNAAATNVAMWNQVG